MGFCASRARGMGQRHWLAQHPMHIVTAPRAERHVAEMTFLINDASTETGTPVIKVVISENADGTVTFAISQLAAAGACLGDLRGLFFDLADESLIGSLSATSSGPLTELRQGDDSIRDLGDGAN